MLPQAYRRVLGLPRVRGTILLMFVARLPMTTMGIAMTLHVVESLDRGYGEAGLVGTATTIGGALGAPAVGRMIDRHGLRRVVAVCGTFSTAFWLTAPHLPYVALAVLAVPAGLLTVPANSLTRQFLTALVPEEQRRPVFTLDTTLAEASFIIGPTLIVLVTTQFSTETALTGIGVCIGLTSAVLYVTNLPIRAAREVTPGEATARPRMRHWLDGRLVAALLVSVGALFTLVGTEIALIAALRENGETAWTGVVIAMMSVASIAGGLVYGAAKKSLPQATLAVLLGALVMPVGLFDHPWWLLGIALIPMNLMCTPTLVACTETVSRLAPPQVRGEAMGLQDSATRLGIALGSPVVGLVIDHGSAGWGFAAAGLGGLLITGVGFLCQRPVPAPAEPEVPTHEPEVPA
ncbi:MFS transporter [Streptomyces litchfieldiae]|uniref:MFS transporter n=1 Tax=Streptomyces litchfieldiae TaxID=3075543 RepID=A0ABU2MQS2_9ACTN|nr:MFS transporter [Streptomyces sp. DSM 44938]MDT0343961.1 MFS transporter [Streptomyces sp. DSM 44938]